jgi:hypothetical protein
MHISGHQIDNLAASVWIVAALTGFFMLGKRYGDRPFWFLCIYPMLSIWTRLRRKKEKPAERN